MVSPMVVVKPAKAKAEPLRSNLLFLSTAGSTRRSSSNTLSAYVLPGGMAPLSHGARIGALPLFPL
jgi:hypothetical protein